MSMGWATLKETDILDMNDDCLRKAFSYLCLTDYTCGRFDDEQFKRRFRHYENEYTILSAPNFQHSIKFSLNKAYYCLLATLIAGISWVNTQAVANESAFIEPMDDALDDHEL